MCYLMTFVRENLFFGNYTTFLFWLDNIWKHRFSSFGHLLRALDLLKAPAEGHLAHAEPFT